MPVLLGYREQGTQAPLGKQGENRVAKGLGLTGRPAVKLCLLCRRFSLDNNAIGPLDKRNEGCRTAEFCSPLIQVCFRDPTGPGTSSSSKDGDVFSDDLGEGFAERRPAHRKDRIHHGLSQQSGCFGEQEDLDVMACFR